MSQLNRLNNRWLYLLVVLAIIAGSFYYFAFYRPDHIIPRQPVPQAQIKHLPKPSGTTATNGAQQPGSSSTINQGTAKDNNGQSPTPITSNSNQWTQSQSGVLTVQQPIANSTLVSGFTLNGTANGISKCQYRLIDDKAGVISQGIMNVVDGKFSATVNFKSYGSTGRLDVFSMDSGGKEINEVQLPVKF